MEPKASLLQSQVEAAVEVSRASDVVFRATTRTSVRRLMAAPISKVETKGCSEQFRTSGELGSNDHFAFYGLGERAHRVHRYFSQPVEDQTINKDWILINSQSTVDAFSNQSLLMGIKESR